MKEQADGSLVKAPANKTITKPSSRNAIDLHFRELYSTPPDFKELSRLDPEFAAVFVAHFQHWFDCVARLIC